MKAHEVMILAVKAVQPSERLQAAKFAERLFAQYFAIEMAHGEFDKATCIELAAEGAAAEVAYRFA